MSKKNKPTHVKLIANPGAGKAGETAKNLKLVMGYLKNSGLKVDVALAKPKEEATPIARQAVKDGYKTVIAMGGDGTLEAVMRGMVGSKVRLGIIAAGTENNIARSLGIPKDLEEACALIASITRASWMWARSKPGKAGNSFSSRSPPSGSRPPFIPMQPRLPAVNCPASRLRR